jgi:hypothetical protein
MRNMRCVLDGYVGGLIHLHKMVPNETISGNKNPFSGWRRAVILCMTAVLVTKR